MAPLIAIHHALSRLQLSSGKSHVREGRQKYHDRDHREGAPVENLYRVGLMVSSSEDKGHKTLHAIYQSMLGTSRILFTYSTSTKTGSCEIVLERQLTIRSRIVLRVRFVRYGQL